jgi:hypothetical protein
MFKRTAGISCSLEESIDGLEINVCGEMFHCTIATVRNLQRLEGVLYS